MSQSSSNTDQIILPRPSARLPRMGAAAAGAYAMLVGALTLAGWAFEVFPLTNWDGAGISMKANPAICAFASGLAILLSTSSPARTTLVRALGALVAFVGGLTLLEHLTGIDIGIDTLLFDEPPGALATAAPGRMGPPASTSFMLIGFALLLWSSTPRFRGLVSVIGAAVLSIASLSLVGYLYGASQLFAVAKLTGISLQMSTALAALGLGLLLVVPDHGIVAAVRRQDAGGIVLRRSLLPIIAIPVLVGLLRVKGQAVGWYDTAFGTAFFALVMVGSLLAMTSWIAFDISRAARRAEITERRLESVLAGTSDLFIVFDHQWRVIHINDLAVETAGMSRRDLLGKEVWELFPDLMGTEFERAAREVMTERKPAQLEFRYAAWDRWFVNRFFPTPEGATLVCTEITGRKRDEQRMTEMNRRLAHALAELQATYEQSPIGMLQLDTDLRYVRINETFARMNGASAAEHIGRTVREMAPDLAPKIEPGFRRVIETEQPVLNVELAGKTRADPGVDHTRLESWFPMRDPTGTVVGLNVVATDITQRMRVEAALRESEEQLRLALSAAGACAWSWEPDKDEESWSSAFREMFGFNADEPGSHSKWQARVHPEDIDRLRARLNTMVRTPGDDDWREEFRINHPERGVRWLVALGRMARDVDGRPLRMHGIDLDITERRKIEDDLRRERSNIETLLETLPIGVFIAHDPDCRRITGNRAASELLRMTPDHNLSKTAPEVERPGHFRIFKDGREVSAQDLPVQRAARGAIIDREEIVTEFSDGTRVCSLVSARPLYDDRRREPRGAVAAILDVTDLKTVEDALHLANRRKDEFLASLAHELRGPLAPIGNMLELMKRLDDDAALRRQARETMERQLKQLVRLVDDLLDISRITRDKLVLRKETVELQSVITDSVETCRSLAESLEHEVTVTLPSESILLNADPVRLTQVFSNLLNNACKYTDRGGWISIAAARENGDVVVRVKDNGMGIPPDELTGIFEMFVQVDQTLERTRGGLGIGLTLAKRLVEMHGGSVRAFSEGSKRGSEFEVRLPVLPAATAARRHDAAGTQPSTTNRRILVVDDNQDSASSLALLLSMSGNQTFTANDGIEALEVAGRVAPDVVLLDIGLPKMNGYDVCRALRQRPSGADMLIVALTGWGQDEDRRKSAEAGFNSHLVKPIDHGTLAKLLEDFGSAEGRRNTL